MTTLPDSPRAATTLRTLVRGLLRRCPRCGVGPLFERWYTIADRCTHCDLDFVKSDSDTWAFMYISTAGLTGFIVLGMLIVRPERMWVGWSVVLPVALVLIVGSLPFRKGLAMAIEHVVDRRVERDVIEPTRSDASLPESPTPTTRNRL